MFIVVKRFGRSETRLKEFSKEPAAVEFILEKLREDRNFKLTAVYGLYEGADLLREYTQSDIATETVVPSDSNESAQQMGSGQSFRPTPFNTTPRLGPQTWTHPEDNKEEDKKDD